MNVVKPKIELIGGALPLRIENSEIRVGAIQGGSEWLVETAMLQCQESADNIEKKRLMKSFEERIKTAFESEPSPHFGILEHSLATFQITGVSRAFSHQCVRHRVASYDQMSQRVVPVRKMGIVIPKSIIDCDGGLHLNTSTEECVKAYEYYKSQGVPLEDARFTLQNAVETQMIMSMNFRSWIHFIRLRTHKSAQWEIRYVAEEVLRQLKIFAPHIFDDKYRDKWE